MKVVFLDFDGVLNGTVENKGERGGLAEFGTALWCSEQIDEALVERLNAIVEATDAVVVISSSWRNVHPLNKLRQMLYIAGFRGSVIGDTPRLHRRPDGVPQHREHEIQAWLDAAGSGVTSFVILDDLDMGFLGERLVRTPVQFGLDDDHVIQAIDLLRAY